MVGIVLDGGGEQGVDEGRFSEARLASNLSHDVNARLCCMRRMEKYHDGEGGTALGDDLVPAIVSGVMVGVARSSRQLFTVG